MAGINKLSQEDCARGALRQRKWDVRNERLVRELLIAAVGIGVAASACADADVDVGSPAGEDTQVVQRAVTAPDVPWIAGELLGRPTDHSVTVNAIAGQGVEAYFEYGTAPGVYGSQTSATTFANGVIEVVIDGLAPNTRYYYRKRHRPTGSTDDFIAGAEAASRTPTPTATARPTAWRRAPRRRWPATTRTTARLSARR